MNILKLYKRNFNKNRTIHIISIGGFAISLALFLIIISYVLHEKSFDKGYPEIDRTYRFVRNSENGKIPLRAKDNLIQSSAEIEKLCFYIFNDVGFKYEHQNFGASILKTDKDFFDVFSVKFIEGNKDESLISRDNLVVTKSFAKKYFGDSEAIGKQLSFFDTEIKTIVAVVADPPKRSCIEYEVILSQDNSMFNYRDCNNNDCYLMYNTAMLLHSDANLNTVQDKVSAALQTYEPYKKSYLTLQKFDEIYFDTTIRDNNKHANVKFIKLLTIVAFIILILAVFNYLNLSVASNIERIKEVCVRKTSGATSITIIKQFIAESYISCLISVCIAFFLIYLFSSVFSRVLHLEFNVKDIILHPYLLVFSIVLIVLLGLAIGFLPAKLASSYKPVQLLQRKGKKIRTRGTGILNVIQFVSTIVLISSLLVINKQIEFSKTKELGFETDHLLHLHLRNKQVEKSDLIKNELLKIPSVIDVTASQGNLFNVWNTSSNTFDVEGKEINLRNVSQLTVDESFLKTLKIPLVLGRDFRKTDKRVCIINENIFKKMEWTNLENKTLWDCKVVGVISDIHYEDIHQPKGYLQLKYGLEDPYLAILNIRIRNEDIPATLSAIKSTISDFDNEFLFEPHFYQETINNYLQHEEKQASAIKLFAFIAIFLSCLGLFGKIELSSKSRIKEIGIRKVNGAKILEIISMLNVDFVKWVVMAQIIAIPIAYMLMKKWLENFTYKTELSWWIFALAGVLALGIALMTISWQSWKAARRNPVESLRYE